MTYPDADVERALREDVVACRLESARHPDVARAMGVRWLPGLVVADLDGRPAHTVIGFLPPADFLNELAFGRGIAFMAAKRYDEAHQALEQVAARSELERAPEAWYWLGISRYRRSKQFADCQQAWSEIVARWPGSQWARRVSYALPGST